MAYIIQSGATSDNLTIDPTSKAARATLYNSSSSSSSPINSSVPSNLSGIIPLGSAKSTTIRSFKTDKFGNLRTGNETILLKEDIGSVTALSTTIWATIVASSFSFAGVATPAGILINSTNLNTAGGGVILYSTKFFNKINTHALVFSTKVRMVHQIGAIIDCGFSNFQTASPVTSTIIDGVAIRRESNGDWYAVFANNLAGPLNSTVGENKVLLKQVSNSDFKNNQQSQTFTITIRWEETNATFIVDDASGTPFINSTIAIDQRTSESTSASHLGAFYRLYNISPTPSPPYLYIYETEVYQSELIQNKNFPHQKAFQNRNNLVSITAWTQLANYANSAAPTTRTITNTTALETTFGGQFAFNNAGTSFGAAETDLAMFTITSSTDLPAFMLTGIRISCANLGAAVGATPYTLQWALAAHCSAVNLATAGTYPPMRIPLGHMTLPATSAIGSVFDRDIDIRFQTPICALRSGSGTDIFHVIVRVVSGTATAAQVIRGTCTLVGYWA